MLKYILENNTVRITKSVFYFMIILLNVNAYIIAQVDTTAITQEDTAVIAQEDTTVNAQKVTVLIAEGGPTSITPEDTNNSEIFRFGITFRASYFPTGKVALTIPMSSGSVMNEEINDEEIASMTVSAFGIAPYFHFGTEGSLKKTGEGPMFFGSIDLGPQFIIGLKGDGTSSEIKEIDYNFQLSFGCQVHRFFGPYFTLRGGIAQMITEENTIFSFDNSTGPISSVTTSGSAITGHLGVGLGSLFNISSFFSPFIEIGGNFAYKGFKTPSPPNLEGAKLNNSLFYISLGIISSFFTIEK